MKKTFSAYAIFSLCAVSAFAQGAGMKQYKSINGKDWVCTTNAVTLSAAEAALRVAGDVAGSNNVAALSGTVTALSGGVTASNALFNAWFAGLFSETNNWNAAFAWGDWSASVASNTTAIVVLQSNAVPVTATNGWTVTSHDGFLTNETDAIALAFAATNRVYLLHDLQDADVFQSVENGTGTVWRISTVTNYQVTLSADFLEVAGSSRPAWTNHAWPFSEDGWSGTEEAGNLILSYPDNSAFWVGTAGTYPSVLIPDDAGTAQGTAVVSQLVSYVTNAISTYATGARVSAVEADVAAIALTTNQVSLNPYVKTLYADLATTNTAGYAGFLTTNAAQSSIATVDPTENQSLAKFRYDLSCNTYAASFNAYVGAALFGTTTNTAYIVAKVFSETDVEIYSVTGATRNILSGDITNVSVSVSFNATTDGYVVFEVFNGVGTTINATVYTGVSYPSVLALNVKPLNYATIAETDAKYPAINGGTLSNATLAGTVTIGGVTRTDWPAGTPGATNLTVGASSVPYDAATRTFDGALLDPALPYRAWTGVVTPANGTATVAYAHGNMPVLTISGATVLTLDPAGYGTGGVSRVSLTLWTGANTLTLATNVVSYAATPTVSTNAWNTILFRRAGNSSWKGVGL